MTGYLPKLVNHLHITMGLLLSVCVIFLFVLFIPDSLTFKFESTGISYKYSAIIIILGIFLLINSFFLFYLSWRDFKNFVDYM